VLVRRAVELRVQDRRFLPESALQRERGDLALPVAEERWKSVGDQRTDRVAPSRLLIGQRAEFEFDLALDIGKTGVLLRGIAKVDDG